MDRHPERSEGPGRGESHRLQLEERLPDPGHLWIRWAPRRWPGPARPWLDLARGELRTGKEPLEQERQRSWVGKEEDREAAARPVGEVVFDLAGSAVDDVLYLPAVSPGFASARAALARDSLATGAPVLVQMLAGDDPQRVVTETRPLSAFFLTQPDDGEAFSRTLPTEPQTATAAPELLVVLDLLDPLLRGDLAALERAPAGVLAAWPLLPGLSDDPALWEEGCARLAAAGVRQAQAVTVRLSPRDRRWLAERRPPGSYDALFHREPPPERAFDRVAHRHGLAPLPARPLPRAPRAVRANRRLAGALALAAELWLRLGRPVGQGEALYRAARFADRSEHDLEALAREGNLALLDWLDPLGRDVVRETAAAGTSFLVEELLAEYLG